MKGVTIGLFALSFCSVSFANGAYVPPPATSPEPVPVNYFDGFYLGIGGGLHHTTADAKAMVVDEIGGYVNSPGQTGPSYPLSVSADMGTISGVAQGFIGFGKTFSQNKNAYVGIELFGRYTPTSMSMSQTSQIAYDDEIMASATTEGKLTNDYSFGGDVRLGYLITPKVMAYVLAGVDVGEFNYKIHHMASMYGAPTYLDYSTDKDTWQYGFMPGVGIEAMLNDHVSLRAQYTYTFFGDGDDVAGSGILYSAEGATMVSSTGTGVTDSIQRGLFTLDLTYHFNGI